MFKTDSLGLEAVIEMVERDLPPPEWLWGVGRCPCGHDDGDFAARITTADYQPSYRAMDMMRGAVVTVQGAGHDAHAHGETAASALGRAYGIALDLKESKA
jgi:hypothetical protein